MGVGPYNWFDMVLENHVILHGSEREVTATDGTLILTGDVTIKELNFKSGTGSHSLIKVSKPGNLTIEM